MNKTVYKSTKNQRGVVIVIALVMLLVMTSIGVTVMSGATLQERMAGNNRQLAIAKIAAESAIREAENYLINTVQINDANAINNIIDSFDAPVTDDAPVDFLKVAIHSNQLGFDPPTLDITDNSQWTSNSREANPVGSNPNQPRFFIEYIGKMPLDGAAYEVDISVEKKDKASTVPHAFRITAIGYGENDNISTILQTIFSAADNP